MIVMYYIATIILLFNCVSVISKPRYSDLDEEERQLYRAAYETPSYDHDQYDDMEMETGKLDLFKDGLWAIKAELKQLKAFKKALAVNMLTTKLKLKELLDDHMQLKKHIHQHVKPVHNYEPSSYQQHGAHQHDPYHGY